MTNALKHATSLSSGTISACIRHVQRDKGIFTRMESTFYDTVDAVRNSFVDFVRKQDKQWTWVDAWESFIDNEVSALKTAASKYYKDQIENENEKVTVPEFEYTYFGHHKETFNTEALSLLLKES